ncbi:PREDICTED: uncharacterized protein LOC106749002 [Dinoponera quadriceps]|uniref:Uncharacterized protein LOC106749002 n=1 Tax=Dinoponera quadriceps TaxID=609295 RepID=A0A6P3XY44_DINQU|nr:PREDICTED: uncharacterized protein LOC106749002 [Dinoponera quadriceps]
MLDERAQAISFTEYYFALVDGILPGFQKHLAKNVMLDWFGKKINGKKNVTTFIKSDKIRTLHVFTEITPVSAIVCDKKQRDRGPRSLHGKRKVTLDQVTGIERVNPEADTRKRKKIQTLKLYNNAVKYLDKVKIIDRTVRKKSEADIEADVRKVNKENDPPDNLHEPEITSVVNEEIQRNINEPKLEEEMASTVKPIKRERGQGDRTVRAQTDTIKYIVANGEVRFTERVVQEDPWSYHWTSLKVSHWVHKCKLQIAYSHRNGDEHSGVHCTFGHAPLTKKYKTSKTDMKTRRDASMRSQSERPTLEEIIKTSNRLIPDVNNFGGYLKSLNYARDRNNFLKDFEADVAKENPDVCLPIVRYVGKKLIFTFKDDAYKKKFTKKMCDGNYRIHRIVYEKVENENRAEVIATE